MIEKFTIAARETETRKIELEERSSFLNFSRGRGRYWHEKHVAGLLRKPQNHGREKWHKNQSSIVASNSI